MPPKSQISLGYMVSGSEPGTSKSVSILSHYCHVLIYPPRLPVLRLVMVSTRVLNGWLQTLSAGHSGFVCGLGSALALLHLTIFHDVKKLHSAVNVAQLPLVPFKLTSFLTSFSFPIALWACNRSSCRTWSYCSHIGFATILYKSALEAL